MEPTVEQLNSRSAGSMVGHLGIEYLDIGPDSIRARMPVDARTIQPAGLLHGGASVALSETLGSLASFLCVDSKLKRVVGLAINANHIRSVRDGYVTGVASPLHIGSSTQVWETRIYDQEDRLVCISRLTVAVLDAREQN